MLRMSVLVLLSVAACVDAPTSPDGATAIDAAADAISQIDAPRIHTTCASSGDGTEGSACCVWDPSGPCGKGMTGLTCAWDGGATQNDGFCQADSPDPQRGYDVCDPNANSCYYGNVCMPAPGSMIPRCHGLCKPAQAEAYCGFEHKCIPITDDGEVGICVSASGL